MTEELNPCPKCNGLAETDIFVCGKDTSLDKFVVRCSDDENCGYMRPYYNTIDDAIEAWNKRV